MESYSNSSFINSENYHMNNSFLNYISYLDASINNNGIISNSPVNFLRSLSQTPQSRCNNIYSSYKVYTVENMSINKLLNILDNLRYEGHIFIPFEILNEIFLDKETIYPLYIQLYDDIAISYFKELDLIFSNNIDNLCYDAAKIGCLNLLRIAYRNGYQWDEKTCEVAAANGHLDCLKYAYENECPMSYDTCIEAEKK